MKGKKVRNRFFKEQYSIDAVLARRIIAEKGFAYTKLESPILYRGDFRDPDIVFQQGFYRRIEDAKFHPPKIADNHESFDCIACTKSLLYAVGFADNPSTTQNFSPENKGKEKRSWVYMIYSEQGIDLTVDDENARDLRNKAKLVDEVTLLSVPPENIIAAFQIETTGNQIDSYMHGPKYSSWYH